MIRDDKAPKILKLTSDSGILNILTDEIAVCKYSDEADIIFNYMMIILLEKARMKILLKEFQPFYDLESVK